MINIVVPMAGLGSRFSNAGYKDPKPLIRIGSKRMIEHVVGNLKPIGDEETYRFIFIVQKSHLSKDLKEALLFNENNIIIDIDYITEGPASTVYLARNYIDNNNSLLIANSDQFVDIDMTDFYNQCLNTDNDGVIMTFISDGDKKWSYVKKDENGYVIEAKEKEPISDEATVGIYFFKRGADFINAYKLAKKNEDRVNNEYYVCPLYNYIQNLHSKIKTYLISLSDMHGLGTPEDLNLFKKTKLFSKM